MEIKQIIEQLRVKLSALDFVQGIVIAGSHATQTEGPNSDLDIGIYYDHDKLDHKALEIITQELDDEHRKNLLAAEGEWGPWVNFGAWIKMQGMPVDLIFRDLQRVKNCIQETNQGITYGNYQPGHPHAYFNVMYRGELASSQTIYAKEASFQDLKILAQQYPTLLQLNIIQYFSVEADFSLSLAKKTWENKDLNYTYGLIFRMVCGFNQIIFAKNKKYLLNEKKAVQRAATLEFAPRNYQEKIDLLYTKLLQNPDEAFRIAKELATEIQQLIQMN